MNERIREFLSAENKSSAQLAEEIGVQPSSISHILSGRNNPSLDFVLKMLDRYKYLSTEWLLFGRGAMYGENQIQTLFDDESNSGKMNNENLNESGDSGHRIDFKGFDSVKHKTEFEPVAKEEGFKVVKIVWFYSNNSFEEYYPQR